MDEVARLCQAQVYDGKDNAIGCADFEEKVRAGAKKLEQEQSFERMVLIDWISQFNDCIERGNHPFDQLLAENDS